MQSSKVLVVDADREAREALVTCLKFVGMEVHAAADGSSARHWLAGSVADVLVLSDEFADCVSSLPASDPALAPRASIIILARQTNAALDIKADDLLHRPVPVIRVVERVESLIQARARRQGALLCFGKLTLDAMTALASYEGRSFQLGQTEAKLLAFFIGAPNRVFSRKQVLQKLWPATVRVAERTVDVHIRRLRYGLEVLGCAGLIQTVRGSGYRFSEQS